jgi:hypothetical protein
MIEPASIPIWGSRLGSRSHIRQRLKDLPRDGEARTKAIGVQSKKVNIIVVVLLLVETKVLKWRHCRLWIASTTPFYTAPLAVVKDSALISTAQIQSLALHSSGGNPS